MNVLTFHQQLMEIYAIATAEPGTNKRYPE
jgi:hypothetical protein